jgi:hypothetical protein
VTLRGVHVDSFHRAVAALHFGGKPALTVTVIQRKYRIELKLPLPTIAYIEGRS